MPTRGNDGGRAAGRGKHSLSPRPFRWGGRGGMWQARVAPLPTIRDLILVATGGPGRLGLVSKMTLAFDITGVDWRWMPWHRTEGPSPCHLHERTAMASTATRPFPPACRPPIGCARVSPVRACLLLDWPRTGYGARGTRAPDGKVHENRRRRERHFWPLKQAVSEPDLAIFPWPNASPPFPNPLARLACASPHAAHRRRGEAPSPNAPRRGLASE